MAEDHIIGIHLAIGVIKAISGPTMLARPAILQSRDVSNGACFHDGPRCNPFIAFIGPAPVLVPIPVPGPGTGGLLLGALLLGAAGAYHVTRRKAA